MIYGDVAPSGWAGSAQEWQDDILPMPHIALERPPANLNLSRPQGPSRHMTFARRTARIRQEDRDLQSDVLHELLFIVRRPTGDLDPAQLHAVHEQSERHLREIACQVQTIIEQVRSAMLYVAACAPPAWIVIQNASFKSVLEDLAESHALSWQEREANGEKYLAESLLLSRRPQSPLPSTLTPLMRVRQETNACLASEKAGLNLLLLTERGLRLTDEAPGLPELADNILKLAGVEDGGDYPLDTVYEQAKEDAPNLLVEQLKDYYIGFLEHLTQQSFDRLALLHKQAATHYERLALAEEMLAPGYEPPSERAYHFVDKKAQAPWFMLKPGESATTHAHIVNWIYNTHDRATGGSSRTPVKNMAERFRPFVSSPWTNKQVQGAIGQVRKKHAAPPGDDIVSDAKRIYQFICSNKFEGQDEPPSLIER